MKDYQQDQDKARPITWLLDLVLLSVLLAILFGSFLGSRPLMAPDEGRYVEIPREMVASGDYITPHLNYIKYFEKPPLFYWLEAIPIKLFGITDWGLRLTPALIALLGCLWVYTAARKLFDRRTGILSALVLATSALYFILGHFISPDIALTLFLSGSLLSFLVAVHQPRGLPRNFWLWAMYILAALATLTKGLVGIIFPGMIIFIWLCLVNEWRQLLSYRLFSGLLLFLLIAVPWHVWVQQRNPEFFQFYFIDQQFLRYFTSYAGREQAAWFFPVTVLAGMFPWICFLLARLCVWKSPKLIHSFNLITNTLQTAHGKAAKATIIPTGQKKVSLLTRLRCGRQGLRQHRAITFLWIWALAISLFFTFSKSLLISYALPVMPPLSILIAHRLSLFWNTTDTGEIRSGFALFLVFATTLTIVGLIVLTPDQSTYWHLSLILLMASAILTTLLYWYRGTKTAIIGLFIGISLCLGTFSLTYPTIDTRSIKPLAVELLPWLEPDTLVVSYLHYYQDLPVYLQRRIAMVGQEGELEFGLAHQNDASRWMLNTKTFWELWSQPKRMFVIMLVGEYNKLEWLTGHYRTLYPVAQTDRNVLLTNHPL